MRLRQAALLGWCLLLLGLLLAALGTCIGSAGFENLLRPLLDDHADPAERAMALQIVWEIRLPRTLGAWAAGSLLGLAGALAQGLFRNPLADPYLLGSASGRLARVAIALAAVGGGAGMVGGSMMNGATFSMLSGHLGPAGPDRRGLCRCGAGGAADAGRWRGGVRPHLAPAAGRRHRRRGVGAP